MRQLAFLFFVGQVGAILAVGDWGEGGFFVGLGLVRHPAERARVGCEVAVAGAVLHQRTQHHLRTTLPMVIRRGHPPILARLAERRNQLLRWVLAGGCVGTSHRAKTGFDFADINARLVGEGLDVDGGIGWALCFLWWILYIRICYSLLLLV